MSSWHSRRDLFELIWWNSIILWFWSTPQAKSILGLDFDLQDINLILSALPGEELEVEKSWQVKVFRGLHLVRSLLVLPDRASSRETEAVGLIQKASPKARDSPGLSSTAWLSSVWVRIPSMSLVAVSRLRGWGGRRDEGSEVEVEGGGGRALREMGRWTEEHCWEVGGGGSSRMDLSSSSCLRNRLFSPLRAFNWRREKETYAQRKTKSMTTVLTGNLHVWPGNRQIWGEVTRKFLTSHSFS